MANAMWFMRVKGKYSQVKPSMTATREGKETHMLFEQRTFMSIEKTCCVLKSETNSQSRPSPTKIAYESCPIAKYMHFSVPSISY